MEQMYEALGISKEVYTFGEEILKELKERFEQIDEIAEYNQMKVIKAMQENRVAENHFAATTDMDITIRGGKPWRRYMPAASTQKPPWCGRRSPVEPMPWQWRCQPIKARG